MAYDDSAPDTVSRSSPKVSARSFTGFVVAKSFSASGAV